MFIRRSRSIQSSYSNVTNPTAAEVPHLTVGDVGDDTVIADVHVETVHPEITRRDGVGRDDAVLLREVLLAEGLLLVPSSSAKLFSEMEKGCSGNVRSRWSPRRGWSCRRACSSTPGSCRWGLLRRRREAWCLRYSVLALSAGCCSCWCVRLLVCLRSARW